MAKKTSFASYSDGHGDDLAILTLNSMPHAMPPSNGRQDEAMLHTIQQQSRPRPAIA
jgi:hypothetical protein